jgi:hypothetical protein
MSSDLPAPVQQAGLLLQQAHIANDPRALESVRQWGHAQIDAIYPEDPIRAPLNVVRRKMAHMEWDRAVRSSGREFRGAIMEASVKQLQFEIERRQANILQQDREEHRQKGVIFDANIRTKELDLQEEIRLRYERERMRLAHDLQQLAEDAASERRKRERVNDAVSEVLVMLSRASAESMGTSSADEMFDLVSMVNGELSRIRHDSALDDDDKHIHIKTLLDSLPHMIRRVQER